MSCRARQMSDQMVCSCGLAWDVNDPAPPECLQTPKRMTGLDAALKRASDRRKPVAIDEAQRVDPERRSFRAALDRLRAHDWKEKK